MNIGSSTAPSALEIREQTIPLPIRDDGYATVMLVGTTGAGKTTVLRQLIGSDRFPATSTSRTTTCDIEIVVAEGSFDAVVTFMDRGEVIDEIENCLHNACRAALDARTATASADRRVSDALLSPRDQRFRLSYLLGQWAPGMASNRDGSTEERQRTLSEYEAISKKEREYNQEILETLVSKIKEISGQAKQQTDATGSKFEDARGASERDAWMELFDGILETYHRFSELVEDILAEILDRFDQVKTGEFMRDETRWPLSWRYQSDNRDGFLTEVRWFSSNHAEQFGRLLTPLVNGVRVRGPFGPTDRAIAS